MHRHARNSASRRPSSIETSKRRVNIFSVILSLLSLIVIIHSVECRLYQPFNPKDDGDSLPKEEEITSPLHFHPPSSSSSSYTTTEKTTTPSKNQTTAPTFPSYNLVLEMAKLSHTIYTMKHYTSCTPPPNTPTTSSSPPLPLLPPNTTCHSYTHNQKTGTQVMIISSTAQKYIAVVFAGTDDVRTTLSDGDLLITSFHGPLFHKNNNTVVDREKIRVHKGFDHAVFSYQMFDLISNIVHSLKTNTYSVKDGIDRRGYKIVTTGHSLGGADALLASASFAALYSFEKIWSITFGCPKVGLYEWKEYYNSLLTTTTTTAPKSSGGGGGGEERRANLSSFRFVLGKDIIPRLPSLPFHHVGHTIQMCDDGDDYDSSPPIIQKKKKKFKAYYLHHGDEALGYAGVPLNWDVESIDLVDSVREHFMWRYVDYLEGVVGGMMEDFYVKDFERLEKKEEEDDDDDGDSGEDGLFGDDDVVHPKVME